MKEYHPPRLAKLDMRNALEAAEEFRVHAPQDSIKVSDAFGHEVDVVAKAYDATPFHYGPNKQYTAFVHSNGPGEGGSVQMRDFGAGTETTITLHEQEIGRAHV